MRCSATSGETASAWITPRRVLCDLPIGSGVVEAACKTLATQRLKRSGMRWRHEGGQAILTLRGLVQSHRFEQAWTMLSANYRADVSVPENVAEFRRKRAA